MPRSSKRSSYNRGDALMKIDLDAREIEADRAMEGSPILLPNFTQPQLFLFGGRRLNCEIQT